MHEPAGLVRVVALVDVLLDQRQRGLRVIIEGDARDGAPGVLRFLLEEGDLAGGVDGDRVVILDFIEVAHVVNRQDRGIPLPAEPAERVQPLAEKIIRRHHNNVVVHRLAHQDQMKIA